jgi:hypothetical protein
MPQRIQYRLNNLDLATPLSNLRSNFPNTPNTHERTKYNFTPHPHAWYVLL